MRIRLVFLTALLLTATVAQRAEAFDNNRRGFLLGLALGPAWVSYDLKAVVEDPGQPPELRDLDRDDSFAFGIDFRIGGGLSDRVMLFYLARIPWFSNPISGRGSSSITTGINALAATYSFRDEAGGPYVLGGLGLASWSNGFPLGSTESWWGFGVIAGAGWEIQPHFPVEITAHWGKPTGSVLGFDTEATTLSVVATVGVMLY
jgi:hypothetical protein